MCFGVAGYSAVKPKLGQVVKKSFRFILCLFGFVKATKFRNSSEYSAKKQCKKKISRAWKGLGTSLAQQCYIVRVFTLFLFSKIVCSLCMYSKQQWPPYRMLPSCKPTQFFPEGPAIRDTETNKFC